MEPNDPSLARTAFQFTLRDLLLVAGAVSVALTVSCWNLIVGIALGVALLGGVAVCAGMRNRRRGAVLVGLVLVFGAVGYVVIQSSTVMAWCGSRELRVD
jgi:hypothetical protein